ncbi:MAG: hypothetical protein R3E68_13855 [Burkholderiaceae bacterium]
MRRSLWVAGLITSTALLAPTAVLATAVPTYAAPPDNHPPPATSPSGKTGGGNETTSKNDDDKTTVREVTKTKVKRNGTVVTKTKTVKKPKK